MRALVVLITSVCFAQVLAQVDPLSVEVRIPVPPTAVPGTDGNMNLAYELHLTNRSRNTTALRLNGVEVLDAVDGTVLARYNASGLDGRVMRPGADRSVRFSRSIDPAAQALLHIWVAVAKGRPAPRIIRHRLTFLTKDEFEQTLDGASVEVSTALPIVLGPPIRGGNWLVHNGPGDHRSPHWGSVLPRDGRLTIPQRFAIDWIGIDAAGRAVRGNVQGSTNRDWVGFGADVIAVADGVVRVSRDGIADHPPLVEPPPPAAVTLEAVGGNYVVLELPSRVFVYYAHLQQNSVAVRKGQQVRRGELLGRLGNSGNTNGPHLHFHVGSSELFDDSQGVPFVVDSFELLGETSAEGALGPEVARVMPMPLPQRHRREMPLHGALVRFP